MSFEVTGDCRNVLFSTGDDNWRRRLFGGWNDMNKKVKNSNKYASFYSIHEIIT